jgi:hypothetical protein
MAEGKGRKIVFPSCTLHSVRVILCVLSLHGRSAKCMKENYTNGVLSA